MDWYLTFNGQEIRPNSQDRDRQGSEGVLALYRGVINALVNNANARGVRPGIGGYPRFIHYDESPWRQSKPGKAASWNEGFDVSFIYA
jgi:hypothetical protein